jgi:hypothetical protein
MSGSRWIDTHYADLVLKHPNQWVAIHADHVAAAGHDLGEVVATATRSFSRDDLVLQFVDDGSLVL